VASCAGTNSFILGYGINGGSNNTTYVDSFNVKTIGNGTSV
jgi:hypothetical protein